MEAKIKNREIFQETKERKDILSIIEAGLSAIETEKILEESISVQGDFLKVQDNSFDLKKYNRIFFIGIGKCANQGGFKIEEIFGEKLTAGLAFDIKRPERVGVKIRYLTGDHPFPTEKNVQIANEIVNFLKGIREDDLIIFMISGGGSTLLCLPKQGNTCLEEESIVRQLFRVGANISEINTIRKHLSYTRGGFLAQYAFPAKVISLVFSDVLDDDLNFIASGPTVLDKTTLEDANNILNKYKILDACHLSGCGLIETPKEARYFNKVQNFIVCSNKNALSAMKAQAEKLKYQCKIVDTSISGEAKKIGQNLVQAIKKEPANTALLYGGETVVNLEGVVGQGGRNQELALSALEDLSHSETLVALNSDGHDNGPYAGALVDELARNLADKKKLDYKRYLHNHDSENFFKELGTFIHTGTTGSNISDLLIILKGN